MAVDTDTVKKIATLAKLAIDNETTKQLVTDLNHILTKVERMAEIETHAVEPMSHPLELSMPLREDTVTESNQRERFEALAPEIKDGLYLVPKIIGDH